MKTIHYLYKVLSSSFCNCSSKTCISSQRTSLADEVLSIYFCNNKERGNDTTTIRIEMIMQQTRTSLIFVSHVFDVCVLFLPSPLQRSHSPYLYSPHCPRRMFAELHDARRHRSTWSFPSPPALCSGARTARGHASSRCPRCSDSGYPCQRGAAKGPCRPSRWSRSPGWSSVCSSLNSPSWRGW